MERGKFIVVRLEGGLGNQLFQYAHARSLQLTHGGRLVFDRRLIRNDPGKSSALDHIVDIGAPRWFDSMLCFVSRCYAAAGIRTTRALLGRTDRGAQRLARVGIFHQFKTRHLDLMPAHAPPLIYLHGNWMSEKYFAPDANAVRQSIFPDRALGHVGQELAKEIQRVNSVAVHVRRGDYLSEQWRDKLHVCTGDYYSRAVAIMARKVERPRFYVFSNSADDTEWIRANYTFLPRDTVFVPPGATDVEHFAIMSACRHFVLANSTFSWWSAYLSTNSRKVVIAPSPWNRNAWDVTDLYCDGWQIVEIDFDSNTGVAGQDIAAEAIA